MKMAKGKTPTKYAVWANMMNENRIAWYPSSNFENYAYVSTLKGYTFTNENAKTAYTGAKSALDSAHGSLSASELDEAFTLLNSLWQSERAKEKAFLKNIFKIDLDFHSDNEIKDLVEGMNFLQKSSIFRSTVDFISKLKWDDSTGRWSSEKGRNEEFYSLFKWEIPEVIANTISKFNFEPYIKNPERGAEVLSSTIGHEIQNIFIEKQAELSVKDKLSEDELAYQDLMNSLLDATEQNHFIQQVLEAYSVDTRKIKESLKNLKKNEGDVTKNLNADAFIKRPVGNGMAGNAYEAFTNRVLESIAGAWNGSHGDIKITTLATGSLNFMKADELLFFAQGEVDTGKLEEAFRTRAEQVRKDDKSVRAQNMEGMIALKEQVDGATLVEVSEKDYNLLGSSFDERAKKNGSGFTAQQNVTLDVLQGVLGRSKLSNATVGDIIFILVNSGAGMLNGDYSDAIHVIEMSIANMLFDDAQLSDELDNKTSNVTTIHVFNLDGVYMPLSVLLEGIYNACNNAYQNITDWVDVRFTAKKGDPNTEDSSNGRELTESDWNEFYQFKRSNNVLNIHFFGNFINWVKQNLG